MMVNTWEYKPHANDGLQYITMYIALRLCFQSIQTCKCWNMAEPNKLITLERRMVRSCQWMVWRSTDLWLALVFCMSEIPIDEPSHWRWLMGWGYIFCIKNRIVWWHAGSTLMSATRKLPHPAMFPKFEPKLLHMISISGRKRHRNLKGTPSHGTSPTNKPVRHQMLAVVLPLFYIRFCSSFVMCPSRLDHEAGEVTVRNVVQTFCWWNEAQKAALRPSNQIPLGSFSKWFKVPSGPPTEVFRKSPVLTCTEVDRLTLKSDQRCKDHHLWLLPAHKPSQQGIAHMHHASTEDWSEIGWFYKS